MASSPPFQLEDQTDEDFFDKLVDDDDDYKVDSISAPNLADGSDSDELKAFANLNIGEVGSAVEDESKQKVETIGKDVKTVSVDASTEKSNSLVSVDSFSFDSVVESDNGIIGHEVPALGLTATESDESAPDLTAVESEVASDLTTMWDKVASSQSAKDAEVAPGLLASEGSGSTSVKEVQWTAFSAEQNGGNGFGSYSDFFSEFGDSAVEQPKNGRANLNSESNAENNQKYGTSAEHNTVGQEQSTNWEELYPGWKYYSNTGQWYQVDSQDSTTSLQQGTFESNEAVDWAADSKSEVSYLQQTTQSVAATFSEIDTTENVTNWDQISSQENNGYPSHMVFDPQYPGWYYDTVAQEWCSLDAYNSLTHSNAQPQDQLHQNGFASPHKDEQNYTQDETHNWGPSSNNSYQQDLNMWQPDATFSDLGQNNQAENHYGQKFSLDDNFSQQNSYNYGVTSPSFSNEKENQGYNTNFAPQFNQPMVEPKEKVHAPNDYYGYQSSSNYSQQPIQSTNSSNYLQQQPIQSVHQLSHAPTAGRSSDGRPPHALVTFGFGGKLIVMKEKNSPYGSQVDGSISILNLTEVVNGRSDVSRIGGEDPCGYFRALQSFPGPLTGGSVGVKDLNKWIDGKISPESPPDMVDYRRSEVVRLLMSLLKIACQHYGKLRSSFGTDTTLKETDLPEAAVAKLFASVRKNGAQFSEYGAVANCLQKLPSEGQMLATAVEVQTLLVAGRKNEALDCAQQGQLWGPALVLAAQLGDKFYIDTVKQMALRQLVAGTPLRTLCLLIAGQPEAVFSTEPTADANGLYSPNMSQQPPQGANGMLDDWEENLAVITANRTKDDELVLIHLGDCLWKERSEIIAAHICYLVAEANIEPYSDRARLCLVGADHWKFPRTYASPEAIQRTEIYEYSKVLGNTQFMLLPFQPYKLIYANMLAEVGRISESLKYCQAVSKTLKTGRAPEVETWRQLISSLEDRIKIHQQGGFSTNLAPAKLVGKLLNLFDNTAQRVVGGLPPTVPTPSSDNVQIKEHYNQSMSSRVSSSQSTMTMSSLMQSPSMEPMMANGNRMTMQNRSASEPNFVRTPRQDQFDSFNEATANSNSNSSAQGKASVAPSTSRFGRFSFGSQLLQKTVGLVLKPRQEKQAKLGETNKFYYDEKLKRWVEEGVDPPAEEAALPPPPTTAAIFPNGTKTDYNFKNALESGGGSPGLNSNGSSSPDYRSPTPPGGYGSSSGMPPIPPTSNQFSARGRTGVRSRYVDTFNHGGGNLANLFQAPAASSIKPASTANPKFFVPTPSSVEQTADLTAATENPSIPTVSNSYQSPSPSPLPPMTMQRFASMDNMTRTNTSSGGSLSSNSRRTASWSGNVGDAFTSPPNRVDQSSPFTPAGPAMPHSSMNGGSYGDDLHEVEL